MLTDHTQAALHILHSIASNGTCGCENPAYSPEMLSGLLDKLEKGGIIRRIPQEDAASSPVYGLARSLSELSLLELLEAIGDNLNCSHPVREDLYSRYGTAANRLGIIGQMTRLYLSGIKLSEL